MPESLAIRSELSGPRNVFRPVLCSVHCGLIVVSRFARVGEHSCSSAGVNIVGAVGRSVVVGATSMAARIGDRRYIRSGAKIGGSVRIGDNCVIGTSAVVNGLSAGVGVTIAGMLARVISQKRSQSPLGTITLELSSFGQGDVTCAD